MAFENPYYHGALRSLIVAFGNYFSQMRFVRRAEHSVTGKETQVIKVPIAMSNRDKWFQLILDGEREKQVKITFPRMAFEITGFSYDSSRKLSRNSNITCTLDDGTVLSVSTPVPWNIEISLYVVSKNQEDCLQIVEQILPMFNPDINFRVLNVLGVETDIPVSINSVSIQDDYQGSYTDDRIVNYTLGFTAKMNIYGLIEEKKDGIIKDVDINTSQENLHVTEDGYSTNPRFHVIEPDILFDTEDNLKESLHKSPAVIVFEKNGHFYHC